jgi:AraC-like DNA-binding protein
MPTKPVELWPIPVQLVATIAHELAQRGISAERLLEDTVLNEHDLLEPAKLLPYRTAQKILTRACELSPIPELGLTIGARQTPSSMGVLGYGINCCATVEDAMNMAVKYARVSSTLLVSEWTPDNDKLFWQVTPPVDLGEILPCVVEEEFSMLCRVYPMLTGHSLKIIEAHFQYPQPDYVSLYKSIFNCPLSFDANDNKLVLNGSILKQPILQANPLSVAAAERLCADFLKANPATDDLVMRVRQIILKQHNKFWDEDTIAQRLNITSRTLRNQLRRAGTNYQSVLDSIRKQISQDDLLHSALNIEEIAEHVGYSDARSFRRAFKKWTGQTPVEYRNLK